MKNYYLSAKIISALFIMNFVFAISLSANWQKKEYKSSFQKQEVNYQDKSAQNKSDSLPKGVTQDWLNSLRDESGNRIINKDLNRYSVQDPEGDALQRKVFTGFASNNNFSYSLSNAGDVNNDGYDDLIVGARGYNSSKGRAYIYFGGMNMNTVPDIIMTGEATDDNFGAFVSDAGDVNGDGYLDVIIGSANNDAGGSNAGRAYIYFGGTSMNNVADIILVGLASGDNFGNSVSNAGDVNGDGYSDVIVGAENNDAGGSNAGRAYIYFGGTSMNSIADVIMTGEGANDNFAHSVSLAGDLNGDGFGDVIAGAYFNDAFGSDAGKAYVFFGGASMNNSADVIFAGEAAFDYFGNSVSDAGDVNGDGFSDLIIGAYFNDNFGPQAGKAYIFFGGASMNNVADVTMTGEAAGDFFGISVSSAGDVNGDGYNDVIAGAYQNDEGGLNAGKAYIYFGGTSMDNVQDITMTGELAGDYFGYSVSTAGDVNGDGYLDVIIGAYAYSSFTGRTYLYDYFMRNEIISDVTMTGEANSNTFGASVSSAGDVNGDGYSDVIVGANGYSSSTGRAYVYFGGAVIDNAADVTMTGETTSDRFGHSVSSAGDVNGDGYSDVIVGAPGYSTNTGRAYIFFGGVSMNNAADVTMTGEGNFDSFGYSVSTAGNVNGDGFSDVIVGAFVYSSSYTGRAYVFFGGAAMNNVADVTMTGEAANTDFGISVSSAGDVNGDGYSDVIVGADYYSSETGRAYIFFGGAVMNNAADVTMTGGAISNNFGYSVSSAGDVNGDGYSDVIVGAYGYSSQTGRAYVFFGGAGMNNVADVTMTGEATNNLFGGSVSQAGDVNGDGYSDVIVGASGYSTNTGRAYVFFGGATMNNAVDLTMTGEATDNNFGTSVSQAGDVNGDGYSDVIVGASRYSSSTGRAYTYLGSVISAKPILNYVKDVPNDQGGRVKLKWAKSSLEVNGFNNISNYLVYRSQPPGINGFEWVQIADITAVDFPFYYYDAETLNDSSSSSNGNTYFLIKARNGNTGEIWNSNIMYGRSIDNIAPLIVSPFSAAAVVNDVRLTWSGSSAPDLLNYILYRSTSPTIDPESEPVFATTTDLTYLDTSPLSGTYYYFIVAQDIHNNKSPVAVTESPNIALNLTMFIEGFYNAGSNSQVSDTVTVELRNSVSPFAVADQSSDLVTVNGIVRLKFATAPNGNYYIAVKHRNSIETWSANAIALSQTTSVNYDLSTAPSQAFGNNMIQVDASPLRFAVFSGDVNQDGTVDATDVSLVDNDAANFVSGYVVTDLTGDDFVDATDFAIADNNAANFVSAITP